MKVIFNRFLIALFFIAPLDVFGQQSRIKSFSDPTIQVATIIKQTDSLLNIGLVNNCISELKLRINGIYLNPDYWNVHAVPVFNNLVKAYGESRNFDSSMIILKRQLYWMKKYGGTFLDYGKFFHNYSKLLYFQSKSRQAVLSNQIALVFKLIHKPVNYKSIISTYRELGACYNQLEDNVLAGKYYTRAIQMTEMLKDSTFDLEYLIIEKYIKVLYDDGDYETIKALLHKSLLMRYSNKYDEVVNHISAYQNLSDLAYRPLNENKQALTYLNKAIVLLKEYQINGVFDPVIFDISKAGIYFEMEQYQYAKEIYETCYKNLSGNTGNDRLNLSTLLFNLYKCCLDTKDYKHALIYLNKYSKLFEAGNSNNQNEVLELSLNKLLVEVHFNAHSNQVLILDSLWRRSNINIHQLVSYNDFISIPFLEEKLKTTSEILTTILNENPTPKIKQLQLNISLSLQQFYGFRYSMIGGNKINTESGYRSDSIINKALELSYDLYEVAGDSKYINITLQLMEKNKSDQLNSSIRQAFNYDLPGIPDGIKAKERILSNQIKHFLSYNSIDNKPVDFANKYQILNDYRSLMSLISRTYPEYFRLKYGGNLFNPLKFNIEDMEQNTSYLNYFYYKEYLYLILIQKDTSLFKKVPISTGKSENEYSQLNDFLKLASDLPDKTDSTLISKYVKSGSLLYGLLIEPVKKYLLPNIMISTNGSLNSFPFEVIPVPSDKFNTTWKNMNYLIKNYNIGYIPSLSILQEIKALNQKSNQKTYLGIAYNPADVKSNQFGSLNYSHEEIFKTQGILGGDFMSGKSASPGKVLNRAANYKILHFACHSYADSINGNKSYLLLASENTNKSGKLFSSELYKYNLNNDLVVLNACESGLGNNISGEGIIGLSRSFFFTGAKSVLPALWKVSDYQASQLLPDFYCRVKAGHPFNLSLQQAKLDYIKNSSGQFAHPFYWGAYVIIGNSSLTLEKEGINYWYVLPFLLCTILMVLWRSFYKDKVVNKN